MLTPTRIYVKELKQIIKDGKMKAFAHITGGGLLENLPRVLLSSHSAHLNAANWIIPKVFGWLAVVG